MLGICGVAAPGRGRRWTTTKKWTSTFPRIVLVHIFGLSAMSIGRKHTCIGSEAEQLHDLIWHSSCHDIWRLLNM